MTAPAAGRGGAWRPADLALLGALLVGLGAAGWQPFARAVPLFGLAVAAYLLLCRRVLRGGLAPGWRSALLAAVLVRAVCLPHPFDWSDDVYRYVHEGRMVLHGESPYQTAPADVAPALRGPCWDRINHPEIPAAYPPAVQYALAAGVWLWPRPPVMKLVFGGLDLLLFAALWLGLPRLGVPRQRALLHGLCPLLGFEFAGQAHSDSLAALALVLALVAAASWRPARAGAALAVAVAAKLVPVVLLPALLRRPGRWRLLSAFAGVLALLYLPFALASPALWRGTLEYAGRWRSNDTLFGLAQWAAERVLATGWLAGSHDVWLVEAQRLAKLPLLAAGLLLLWWCQRRRLEPARTGFVFLMFFFAAAPTVHPWYVVLLVPFLCLYPSYLLLAFTGTVFLAYHVLPAWHAQAVWRESLWIKALEYAPFYAALPAALRAPPARA